MLVFMYNVYTYFNVCILTFHAFVYGRMCSIAIRLILACYFDEYPYI